MQNFLGGKICCIDTLRCKLATIASAVDPLILSFNHIIVVTADIINWTDPHQFLNSPFTL